MKSSTLRQRLADLDARIPPDPDRLCCLETWGAYREALMPFHEANWTPALEFDPGDPAPPLEPPELPSCRRTGGPLCALMLEREGLVWTRRRQLALDTTGLDEGEI